MDGETPERVVAAGLYILGQGKKPLLCDDIWQLKERDPEKAGVLVEVLHAAVKRHPDLLDGVSIITSVPRGSSGKSWDQARLLAIGLAGMTGIPYEELLSKASDTTPRHEMDKDVKAAQTEVPTTCVRGLAGESVLIVDDTLVRGGTMRGAAKALREAGAGRLQGLVVGRAVDRGTLDYLGIKLQ